MSSSSLRPPMTRSTAHGELLRLREFALRLRGRRQPGRHTNVSSLARSPGATSNGRRVMGTGSSGAMFDRRAPSRTWSGPSPCARARDSSGTSRRRRASSCARRAPPRAHLRLLHLQGVVLADLQVGVRIVRVRGARLRLGGGARGIIATWRALLGGPRPGGRCDSRGGGRAPSATSPRGGAFRAVGVLLGRRDRTVTIARGRRRARADARASAREKLQHERENARSPPAPRGAPAARDYLTHQGSARVQGSRPDPHASSSACARRTAASPMLSAAPTRLALGGGSRAPHHRLGTHRRREVPPGRAPRRAALADGGGTPTDP